MSKMRTPEMSVVRFKEADVIVASGTVGLSNFNDGNASNNTFSFNGQSYNFTDNDGFKAFRSALSDYVGDAGLANAAGNRIYFGDNTVFGIYKGDHSGVDGEYTYNGEGTFRFSKKQ